MARVVCGVTFQTKKGTKAARNLRLLLLLSFLLAVGWAIHGVYFVSYLSIPAFVFAGFVLANILVCYYGANGRHASSLKAFHYMTVTLTLCMLCIFLVVFITFVGMDGQQYISSGWKNWNLTLSDKQKELACTDKLPVSDPDATNKDAGGHQQDPVPLGCDFYYNMREQQLIIFLCASVTAALLSCLTCVLSFQMYEVIAGPQQDPYMKNTLESAENKLENLLSGEWNEDDLEAHGSKQVLPRDEEYFLLN